MTDHTTASRHIFTIYAGLTASGYDLARTSQRDVTVELLRKIEHIWWPEGTLEYFRQTRSTPGAGNPYWPRIRLLTQAALHLPPSPPYSFLDPARLAKRMLAGDEVVSGAIDKEMLAWVGQLPKVVSLLHGEPVLNALWQRDVEHLDLEHCEDVTRTARAVLVNRMGIAPHQFPNIMLVTNPLQDPAATDAVRMGKSLYLFRAEHTVEACVHELLRHFFAETLTTCAPLIDRYAECLHPVLEQMRLLGIAPDDSPASWRRAFGANLLRAADIRAMHGHDATAMDRAGNYQARCGFAYVPVMLQCFATEWTGVARMQPFIEACLRACERIWR